jgi:hypothetical protein
MFVGRKEALFIIALVGLVALLMIVFLTPVYSWLLGSQEQALTPSPVTTEAPVSTSSPLPSSSVSPSEPSLKLVLTLTDSTLSFSEQELQNMSKQLMAMVNNNGKANVSNMNIKLEPDKILISASGQAMGISAEAENLAVSFTGRTVTVEGDVKAYNLKPKLTLIADINTVSGKPVVEVKRFRLGGLPMTMLNLSPERVASIINSNIESRGLKLPSDLESISIKTSE